ncbi:hypothetical protein [Janthinobacterium sp. PC23-8]|uniref:hypothetical protein n=1 Tax=Janthinobacterium sp. PC23-8 TaxID=2012679 RepID=UPI00113FDA9B|nr:hypothetical protein [Janthinobacterium sp. PC23-8]
MEEKIISLSYDEGTIALNGEVIIDVGVIKQIVFDRENQKGKIIIENGGQLCEFSISLKSAYALIVFLGTSSWVNL